MTSPDPDYYKILSVSPKSKPEEIKRAWRKKMMEFHPDHHADAQEHYEKISREINQAYAVLSDPEARAEFDAQRAAEAKSEAPRKERPEAPPLYAWEKIILTLVVICLSVLFFGIPQWELCGNALCRYLFSGIGAAAVSDTILIPAILIGTVFLATALIGKYLRERFLFLGFWEVFLLAIASAESVVIPLREHNGTLVLISFILGLFCIFQTYGTRKNLIWGMALRLICIIGCIVSYRAGTLIFNSVDEFIPIGCFLLFAVFLVSYITSVFSDNG